LSSQDYVLDHYGYEDLTQLDDCIDDQPIDTDNFKDAEVNELFWHEMKEGEREEDDDYYEVPDSSIRKLKELVLDLDWEITDDNIACLSETIKELQDEWQSDKVVLTLLKVLMSLAKYIGINKSKALASAVNLVFSTYNALEKIVLYPDMSDSDKKKLLNEELLKFETLKRAIARSMAENLEGIFKKSRKAGNAISSKSLILPLKVLVFSIDGNVSENIMHKFANEIGLLEKKWENDKNLLIFLKLFRLAGGYINKRKAQSHPAAFEFLTQTYNSLERIVLAKGLTEEKIKNIAANALKKYKQLKQTIVETKGISPEQKTIPLTKNKNTTLQQKPDNRLVSVDFKQSAAETKSPAGNGPAIETGEANSPQELADRLDSIFPEEEQKDILLLIFDGEEQTPECEVPKEPPAALSGVESETDLSPDRQEDNSLDGIDDTIGEIGRQKPPVLSSVDIEDVLEEIDDQPSSETGELAEIIDIKSAVSRRSEQPLSEAKLLSEKIDLLLKLQLFQSVCVFLRPNENNVFEPEARKLLNSLLTGFKQQDGHHEKQSDREDALIRQTIEKLHQLSAKILSQSSSPSGAGPE